MADIKFDIPAGTQQSKCRSKDCGAIIYWIKTEGGKAMPVDPDGTSHFATCPDAERFRKYNPDTDTNRPAQIIQRDQLLIALASGEAGPLTSIENAVLTVIEEKFSKGHKLSKDDAGALLTMCEKYTE